MRTSKIQVKSEKKEIDLFEKLHFENVKLGADPEIEFLALRKANGFDAETNRSNISRNQNKKYLNFSASAIVPASTRSTTRIGVDGNSVIGELRPKPCYNAVDLTLELSKEIKKLKTHYVNTFLFNQEVKELIVITGHGKFNALGGHIHFGETTRANEYDVNKLCLYLDIISIFLAQTQNVYNAKKRKRSFGQLNAWGHTSHAGFEYRTLPSFLYSPVLTCSIFALYHSVAVDFINNKIQKKKIFAELFAELKEYLPTTKELYKNNDLKRLQNKFPNEQIIKAIKTLTLYKHNYSNYKKYIDFLIEKLLDSENKWNNFGENKDIISRWGFKDVETTFKKEFYQFNVQDDYLNEIQEKYKSNAESKIKAIVNINLLPVYIYGLSAEREYQFRTNNEQIKNLIREFYTSKSKTAIVIDNNTISRARIEIGIRHDLRQNNQDEILELLSFIKKKFIQEFKINNKKVFRQEEN